MNAGAPKNPGSLEHWLHTISRSAAVSRYHTEATVAKQSVGEHTYGVFWVAHWLLGGDMSSSLAMAIMAHDLEEHVTGDIPGPTKERFKEPMDRFESAVRTELGLLLPATTPEENHILKVADLLEGYLWCTREFQRGNRLILHCRQNFESALAEKLAILNRDYRHTAWHVRAINAWRFLSQEKV